MQVETAPGSMICLLDISSEHVSSAYVSGVETVLPDGGEERDNSGDDDALQDASPIGSINDGSDDDLELESSNTSHTDDDSEPKLKKRRLFPHECTECNFSDEYSSDTSSDHAEGVFPMRNKRSSTSQSSLKNGEPSNRTLEPNLSPEDVDLGFIDDKEQLAIQENASVKYSRRLILETWPKLRPNSPSDPDRSSFSQEWPSEQQYSLSKPEGMSHKSTPREPECFFQDDKLIFGNTGNASQGKSLHIVNIHLRVWPTDADSEEWQKFLLPIFGHLSPADFLASLHFVYWSSEGRPRFEFDTSYLQSAQYDGANQVNAKFDCADDLILRWKPNKEFIPLGIGVPAYDPELFIPRQDENPTHVREGRGSADEGDRDRFSDCQRDDRSITISQYRKHGAQPFGDQDKEFAPDLKVEDNAIRLQQSKSAKIPSPSPAYQANARTTESAAQEDLGIPVLNTIATEFDQENGPYETSGATDIQGSTADLSQCDVGALEQQGRIANPMYKVTNVDGEEGPSCTSDDAAAELFDSLEAREDSEGLQASLHGIITNGEGDIRSPPAGVRLASADVQSKVQEEHLADEELEGPGSIRQEMVSHDYDVTWSYVALAIGADDLDWKREGLCWRPEEWQGRVLDTWSPLQLCQGLVKSISRWWLCWLVLSYCSFLFVAWMGTVSSTENIVSGIQMALPSGFAPFQYDVNPIITTAATQKLYQYMGLPQIAEDTSSLSEEEGNQSGSMEAPSQEAQQHEDLPVPRGEGPTWTCRIRDAIDKSLGWKGKET